MANAPLLPKSELLALKSSFVLMGMDTKTQFISQSNFPRFWLFVQKTIGGNRSKQQLAVRYYKGEPRILEIGCSMGNVSEAFKPFRNITFKGIDIDSVAIERAKKRFKSFDNFSFECRSLSDLSRSGEVFDYVIFAGILHHVNNEESTKLLSDVQKLIAEDGRIIISEPEALRSTDNLIFRIFYKLEQGMFLRSRDELERLIEQSGATIELSEDCLISPGIIRKPFVARFNLICTKPNKKLRPH